MSMPFGFLTRWSKTCVLLCLTLCLPVIAWGQEPDKGQDITWSGGAIQTMGAALFSDRLLGSLPRLSEEPFEVPRMAIPGDLPMDSGLAEASSALDIESPLPLAAATPPKRSFQALVSNLTKTPPDTMGAVGPKHVLTTLNTQVRVQNRAGDVLSTVSLDAFWSPSGYSNTFDPRVVYDPLSKRFFMVSAANAQKSSSTILLAASRTDDPMGEWVMWHFDKQDATVWLDYPQVASTGVWVTETINTYSLADNTFAGTYIVVNHKNDLMNDENNPRGKLFTQTKAESSTLAPAQVYDPKATTQPILCTWSSKLGAYKLFTISGTAESPVRVDDGFVSGSPWSSTLPPAPQLGTSTTIDSGDTRIMNALVRNGKLWFCHTVGHPTTTPTRTAVRWNQYDLATATMVQTGLIDDYAQGGRFLYYPTLAVNKYEDMVIGYSGSSPSSYAGAYYAMRSAFDAPGTVSSSTLLKAGEASYSMVSSTGRTRWGDYSATWVDPVNDTDFWTIQEYATTPSGGISVWATWWGLVGMENLTGWWFDAAVPGQGMAMERQGDTVFLAWYAYDSQGRPRWYIALCPKTGTNTFAGDLLEFTGWPLGNTATPTQNRVAGHITLNFTNASQCSASWTMGPISGAIGLVKFMDQPSVSPGLADSRNINGWWWDPSAEGMGVFLEVQGNGSYLAWYHYRDDGTSRWWSMFTPPGGFTESTEVVSGDMTEYSGGQVIGGPYKPAGVASKRTAFFDLLPDKRARLMCNGTAYFLQRFTF